MDRSDGWSKRSVCGSSILRRPPIRVDSSVALMESSPADMRGASTETEVPASSHAVATKSWISASHELSC